MEHPNIGLIFMPGCEAFGQRVLHYLSEWNGYGQEVIVGIECPRFSTGEAKGLICESVRGKDIFIIADMFNYSITYKMRGLQNHMSPDDHFQNLKRILSAVGGKASRSNVIMPMLYEGRQHRRTYRESLDCAHSLQELCSMGVKNIVTFDAHDPRIQNAVPLMGFDNLQPRYQMIKAFTRQYPDIRFHPDETVIISPDEGGISRCFAYCSVLGLDLGIFYKRRDAAHVVDGTNPIEYHEYIGNDIAGKNAVIIDDMISSGASLLDTFLELRQRHTRRNFAFVSFGLFCNGFEKFDAAYDRGLFDRLFVTNLTYLPPELESKPWLSVVDMSKYTAYVIDAISHENSVGEIINPDKKINALLSRLK